MQINKIKYMIVSNFKLDDDDDDDDNDNGSGGNHHHGSGGDGHPYHCHGSDLSDDVGRSSRSSKNSKCIINPLGTTQ